MLSSNHATKVINATAKITPGIAQPEIDIVDKKFKILFLETLFPQFEISENKIRHKLKIYKIENNSIDEVF